MKNLSLLFLAAFLLTAGACKKDSSTTTPVTPVSPTNPASPYYFKFTFNGADYNFNANFPQYMPFYANEIGGYQLSTAGFFPSVGIRLSWPGDDTVKESDVMALAGKTLHFNDTAPHPIIIYDEANTALPSWYSIDTSNTNYNVKITNVTFLKRDTALGNPVRTYVITGTCSAVITQGDSVGVFSGGSFNFVISRQDW